MIYPLDKNFVSIAELIDWSVGVLKTFLSQLLIDGPSNLKLLHDIKSKYSPLVLVVERIDGLSKFHFLDINNRFGHGLFCSCYGPLEERTRQK